MQYASRDAGRKRTGASELFDLAQPDFDQGKLGRDKEPVRQNEKQNKDQFQSGHDVSGRAPAGKTILG